VQHLKPGSDGDLYDVIVKGLKDEAKNAARSLLKYKKPLEVVNEYIIPALDFVGEKYEKGDIFLPQLIHFAETVKSAFEVIKEKIKENPSAQVTGEKVILATVKGDVHDIGKNIVKVLLENYGYEIIDLGKDVPQEKIVEEAVQNNVKLVGLSALMTTTLRNMEEVIKALHQSCHGCKVMVGGAVLNKEYADRIGADYYAGDAKEAVTVVKKAFAELKQ
jgi:5-methyltetrahydrofolate--homocysteine methyltransferase